METSASFEARSAPLPYPTRLMEGFRCRCREHLPLESVAPLEACLQLPWGALPRAPALSLRLSTRIQVTSIPSVSSPASHSPSSCDGSRNVQASPRSGANPSAFSRSCWSRWRGGTHRRPPTRLRSRSRRSLAISICLEATRTLFQRLARSGSGIFRFPCRGAYPGRW
jgi:hypothetical protein